jgi:hypothetical protein
LEPENLDASAKKRKKSSDKPKNISKIFQEKFGD